MNEFYLTDKLPLWFIEICTFLGCLIVVMIAFFVVFGFVMWLGEYVSDYKQFKAYKEKHNL